MSVRDNFTKYTKTKPVPIVVDGDTFYIRPLTVGDGLEIPDGPKAGLTLMAKLICDEEGKPIFTADSPELLALDDRLARVFLDESRKLKLTVDDAKNS